MSREAGMSFPRGSARHPDFDNAAVVTENLSAGRSPRKSRPCAGLRETFQTSLQRQQVRSRTGCTHWRVVASQSLRGNHTAVTEGACGWCFVCMFLETRRTLRSQRTFTIAPSHSAFSAVLAFEFCVMWMMSGRGLRLIRDCARSVSGRGKRPHIFSGASMPSRDRPSVRTREVRSQSCRRLVRSVASSSCSTWHAV